MEKEALKGLQYTGTKTVYAAPLNRTEAAARLGRNLKSDNNDEEEGYLVRYGDDYMSWSPKSTFEEAYKPSATFVDRMRIELDDLHKRIVSLHGFMLTGENKHANSDVDRFYKVKVNWIDLDEKTLKEKRTPQHYLVAAGSLDAAHDVIRQYLHGSLRDYDVATVDESKIVDVIIPASKDNGKDA